MTIGRPGVLALALVVAAVAGLASGCASNPTSQIDAATSSAIATSLRGLPAVTGATTSETRAPIDTLAISMTTALDRADPEDVTSATALLRAAADMVYATRHNTVEAVEVTVYGVDSAAAAARPTILLAQDTLLTRELAPGSS